METPNQDEPRFSGSQQTNDGNGVLRNWTKSQPASPNCFVARSLRRFLFIWTLFAAFNQCLAQGGPPVILTQPQGKIVGPGDNVTFKVAVSSVTFPTYKWRFNGTNIPGATATNYTINNAQPSQAGNYSVVVTNAVGAVTSFNAVLTVTDPSGRFDAAYVANYSNNTVSVIARTSLDVLGTIAVGTNPVKVVSTPNGQRVFVANQGSDNVSIIDTTSGSVIATVAVGDQPSAMTVSPDSQRLYVANYGSASLSVIDINSNVVITNVTILPNPTSIAYHPVRAELWIGYENLGTNVVEVRSALDYSVLASLTSSDRLYGSGFAFRPDGTEVFAAESCGCCGRFHRLSGTPSGGTIAILQPDILYDNTGAAYAVAVNPVSGQGYLGKSGHCGGTPRVYEYGSARSLVMPSLPRGMAVDAERNRLWATLANGTVAVVDTGSLTTVGTVTVGASPEGIAFAPFTVMVPTIAAQPQSQTVGAGANVTFSVAAMGTAPLSYQWRFNGINIGAATSSSLALSNVQSANEGAYTVVVSNAFGSVTSASATLTVDAAVTLGFAGFTTNGFQFQMTGPVGMYVLQLSTNLVDWSAVSTNNAPNGVIDFIDPHATSFERRFYRVHSQ